jgi:cell division protein FtsN
MAGTQPGAVPAPQAALAGTERGATYLLQAGAFRGPEDADAMKLRLALMGLEAQIVTAEVSGTTLYRVRVGPYAGLDAMTKARTRLAENGVEATVLRQR